MRCKPKMHKIAQFAVVILLSYNGALAETVNLRVDAAKNLGPVPDILSSSIWAVEVNKYPTFVIEKYFQENNPSTVMLTITFVLKLSTGFEDYTRRLQDFFRSGSGGDALIQGVNNNLSTLIIGFDPAPMPGWLSSRTGNKKRAYNDQPFYIEELSPPGDDAMWGKVVDYTLRYLKDVKEIKKLGFYVGHEPNWMWLGSQKSFFNYYEIAANSAKNVSRDIYVGGIGTWSVEASKLDCTYTPFSGVTKNLCEKEGGWSDSSPMIKAFIDYVSKKGIPLDFVNWHKFQGIPAQYFQDVQTIRDWLRQASLKNVKLYPADWTYWRGASAYPADYLDGEEMAAYAMNTLFYMWTFGVDWHGHDFDVRNYGDEERRINERKNATFIGDWSMVTRQGVKKPIYNAFKALSLATGKEEKGRMSLLESTFPKGMVTAIASMNQGKDNIYILVTHFLPSFFEQRDHIVGEIILNRIPFKPDKIGSLFTPEQIKKISEQDISRDLISKEKDVEKKKILKIIKDMQRVKNCIRNMTESNQKKFLKCSADLSGNLESEEVRQIMEDIETKLAPIMLRIEFLNLPFRGKVGVTTYVIDNTHSNACTLNKSTEPWYTRKFKAPCGVGGIVDKSIWSNRKIEDINNRKEISLEGSKNVRRLALEDNHYSLDLEIEPNATWLIVLSKERQ